MARSRGRYVARRCLFALVTIFAITSVLFFLFRLAPGDPVGRLAGPHATVDDREQIKKEFCLDKSVVEQYARCYLGQLVHGNLGLSINDNRPVSEVIWEKLKISVPLVLVGEFLAIAMGLATGVLAAARRLTWSDKISTTSALVTYSIPTQWFGLVLLLAFTGVLPTGGRSDIFTATTGFPYLLDVMKHMILPVTTLAVTTYGAYTIIVRSAMLESLGEDYVMTARAKGLSRRRIVWRHAFRNASPPIVALVALSLAYVPVGAILVETVFSWPGIGLEFYKALGGNDWPLLNGISLVLITSVVVFNLAADLLLFKLDPRVTE